MVPPDKSWEALPPLGLKAQKFAKTLKSRKFQSARFSQFICLDCCAYLNLQSFVCFRVSPGFENIKNIDFRNILFCIASQFQILKVSKFRKLSKFQTFELRRSVNIDAIGGGVAGSEE